jgi:membrane-bound ClpP family serine protease
MLSPSNALIVAFAGFIGIVYELRRPGSVWPGALGSAAVLAGFHFGWRQSPTALGLTLLAAAWLLFVAEVTWRISFVAGVPATTAVGLGLCWLFADRSSIPTMLALPVSIAVGSTISLLSYSAKRARRNKISDL